MKILFKTIILILISIIIIYFMSKHNFIQVASIKSAFMHNKKLIYFIFFLQIISYLFMALRYFSLLKIFKINVDLKNATAATFVSNGLGLWMPGSMAFIEIIRISLMLGAEYKFALNATTSVGNTESSYKDEKMVLKNKEQLSLRAKLTTISLFDRLIGLWAMLFVGLVVIGNILYFSYINNKNSINNGTLTIFIFTFFLLLFITLLPYFSRKIIVRKIIEHIERIILLLFRKGFLNKLFRKIFFEINAILDAIAIGGKKINKFILPILYSFLCVFIQALSIYYAAIAIFSFISFSAILATVSILAIATLLPIGFGGLGGVQVIAAFSMSFFGVPPHSAASAQLLQTAINIISISFAGVFFLKLTSKQIKSIMQMYETKKLRENQR